MKKKQLLMTLPVNFNCSLLAILKKTLYKKSRLKNCRDFYDKIFDGSLHLLYNHPGSVSTFG